MAEQMTYEEARALTDRIKEHLAAIEADLAKLGDPRTVEEFMFDEYGLDIFHPDGPRKVRP